MGRNLQIKSKLTYQFLYDMYITNSFSIRAINKITNISTQTIHTYLRKYDLFKSTKTKITIGDIFGNWKVIRFAYRKNISGYHKRWECLCLKCKQKKIVISS